LRVFLDRLQLLDDGVPLLDILGLLVHQLEQLLRLLEQLALPVGLQLALLQLQIDLFERGDLLPQLAVFAHEVPVGLLQTRDFRGVRLL